jgi:hypothetical protein
VHAGSDTVERMLTPETLNLELTSSKLPAKNSQRKPLPGAKNNTLALKMRLKDINRFGHILMLCQL